MADSTFGRRILGQPPAGVLALERVHSAKVPYPDLDSITSEIVLAALSGTRVAALARPDRRADLDFRADLQLLLLTGHKRQVVSDAFGLPAQQARGAWFLPEEGTVCVGNANLPYYFARYSRFASGAAHDESAKVRLSKPDALYFWAVLDPLFAALFRPFDFRGPSPPKGDAAAQKDAWRAVDTAYAALGIDGGNPLATIRYGGGWSRLRSAEHLAVKQALLEELRRSIQNDVGARYRTWATGELVAKYYAKPNQVQPLMRQVLSKPFQRTLAAFFGGDWLGFVLYLGEAPNPGEQISVTLPEARLYVDVSAHAATVAVKHGVSTAEVERILAAFWESETSTSPVHRRLEVLRAFWRQFDIAHARQVPGMPSLWGFLAEGEFHWLPDISGEKRGPDWYHPGSYRQILPDTVLTDIDELWGGLFLPAYPDRIVSAVNPYWRMNETFGSALRFWHGAALTAWFVSEGPYSLTDTLGLARYHARDLKELEALGCPVGHELFAELIEAEKQLGPPEPIEKEKEEQMISAPGAGITLTLTTSVGARRAGFERLRDVLTRRRRSWVDRYLEAYLRARWDTELRAAAGEYNKLLEVKRKPPTLKQFAKFADAPTNHWFGGDVSQLYRAIGERAPVVPVRTRYLREPATAFAMRVFAEIGGKPTRWEDLAATIEGGDREKQDAEWRVHGDRVSLAGLSIRYVQLREALGWAPTLQQFGKRKFFEFAPTVDPDLASLWKEVLVPGGSYRVLDADRARVADLTPAWERYSDAIERCLAHGAREETPDE